MQYLQRAQPEQFSQDLQPQQFVQSLQFSQSLQSTLLSSAACAASADPQYSTEQRLPLESVIQVVIDVSPFVYAHNIACECLQVNWFVEPVVFRCLCIQNNTAIAQRNWNGLHLCLLKVLE